ncbi:MAG: hypothetical protein ACXADU_04200 [Promethearchaeota archaeon]|jgi:hypothetical protein
MTRILINVWYPVEKSDDVGKRYLEVEKVFPFPAIIKPMMPWETWAVKSGLKGSGIFETPEDKFEEAINYFVRRLTMYANAIEGYTFEIAASVTSEKGRNLIGKSLSDCLIPE